MELKDLNFKPDYNKTTDNIAEDFYLPAMRCSCAYDRISGYFGSTIYIIAWSALKSFIDNGGHMRIICSPVISDVDKAAMEKGYNAKADATLFKSLNREFEELFNYEELEKPAKVLEGLIAEGILDIKIAVPETGLEPDLERLFHDKLGIFTDCAGNSVGFRGSMNETFQGLSEDGNLESIDVFPSWSDQRDALRLESAKKYFQQLWNESEPHVKVYKFPEALKKKIINKIKGENWRILLDEISTVVKKSRKWCPDKKHSKLFPRKHQVQALENWVKHGRRGIFEHATGSGKTFTAICAIREALDRKQSVVVLVPSKELLYQWKKEILDNITDISINFLLCGDGNNNWKRDGLLSRWTRKGELNRITLAIMDTACQDSFVKNVVNGPQLLLIVDEVHRIGSKARRNILNIDAGERLGLSATPVRYGDPDGTNAIFTYFGGIVPPIFTLEDAIKSGVLTKYYYHPMLVKLTPEEQENWDSITKEINRLIAISSSKGTNTKKSNIFEENERLKRKLIARARIVKQATQKVPLALEIVNRYYKPNQRWIIYCDNQNQLSEVLKLLLKNDYDAYEYYSEMAGDRETTLKYFRLQGGILVSIRCLDEGVDIPATTHALILASSKNPREFIQRRGRILRRYPGKYFAQLFDAIVMPERMHTENDKSSSIIEAELSRAIQFGEWAENPSCVADLRIIARRYGIDYDRLKDGGFEDENEEES